MLRRMLLMRCALALLLCLGFASLAWAEDDKPSKPDEEAIQGKWKAVSVERDGQKVEEERQIVLIFKEDTVSHVRGEDQAESDPATFKLDPDKKPKHIDITPESGPQQGKTVPGVYELSGDSLKVCFARPGENGEPGARPAELKGGQGFMLVTFERQKE